MRRLWRAVAGSLLALLWAGAVEAQIPVTDALHVVETVLQAYEDIQQHRRQIEWAVKRIENPIWRDLVVRRMIDESLDAIREGESIPYAVAAAGTELRRALPGPLKLNGREYTADILLAHWARRTRDTMAGGLESASVHARDYEALLGDLTELKGRADGAKGQGEDLHVANQYNALIADELAKIHQQLAVLINVESVGHAYTVTSEASAEATARAWLSGELLAEGKPEDPYEEVAGVWPWGDD